MLMIYLVVVETPLMQYSIFQGLNFAAGGPGQTAWGTCGTEIPLCFIGLRKKDSAKTLQKHY